MKKHPFEPRGIVGDFYPVIPSPIHEAGLMVTFPKVKMQRKIYLAHNFNSRFKVKDIITPIIQALYPDYQIENPFMRKGRENQGLYDNQDNSEERLAKLAGDIDQRSKTIVENDLDQLKECDILVSYIEKASIGTACEIFYNSWVLKRETILIFDTKIDLCFHPFLQYLSTKIIILDQLSDIK